MAITRTDPKPSVSASRFLPLAAGIIAVALVVTVVLGSWYTVDQTERGVLLRNGAFVGVSEPGLHFKIPWIESVVKIGTTAWTLSYNKLNSYSADQQPADLRVSVTAHVPPTLVGDVYSRFGSNQAMADRLITPRVSQEVKVVFGRYTAASAIQDRAKLNTDAFNALKAAVAGDPEVVIEGVQIENIDFSPDYIKAVEQRMQAEVAVQQLRQKEEQAKVSAEITVTQANAEAAARVAAAKAEADATRLRGDAEASAIKARSEALKDNPNLIALTQAERWDGKLPTTMVPGSTLPFLSVPSAPGK